MFGNLNQKVSGASATTSISLHDISNHVKFFLKNQQNLKMSHAAIFENSVGCSFIFIGLRFNVYVFILFTITYF